MVKFCACFITQEQLSLYLIVLHVNDSPSLIFCSFFKRTSFTVVLSQRFYGPKPVCSSVDNVSILFVFEIKESKEFSFSFFFFFYVPHANILIKKQQNKSHVCS